MERGPDFIGRSEELGLAEDLFHRLGSGRSGSLIVQGQAGAGKSRLLQEIIGRAEDLGIVAVSTTCLPFSTPLPFDPLLDLLGQLERAGAEVSMPARGREGDEIFSAIRSSIESLGNERSVLLVVDDLHWSDTATRDLIHYCVVRLVDLGVAWLLATRPERGVQTFVHHLTRIGVAERLLLAGFSVEEMRSLAASILGPEHVDERLIENVFRRTQGDPFLSVELLRSLGPSGPASALVDAVPTTVTEMVEERMRAVDEGERDLLEWAAVLPEPIASQWLSALCSQEEVEIRSKRLVDLGFLVEATDGWAFTHALVRDAVYASLDGFEKTRRHGKAADLLKDAPLGQRAPQLAAAGRHAEAAEAYVALGYEAWLRGGPDDAAKLYALADRLAVKAEDPALRFTARAGEVLSLLRMGASEARPKGERLRVDMRVGSSAEEHLSFLSRYSVALWDELSDLESALDVLGEAHGLMNVAEGEVLAEASLARAYVLDRAGRSAEASPFAKQALDTAGQVGDRYLEVRALNCLGLTTGQTTGTPKGIAILRKALQLATEEDLPKEAALACLNLSYLLQVGGDEDEAEKHARMGLAIRHVPPTVEALLRGNVALGPMNRGELRTALDHLLSAQAVAARAGRATEERIMVQQCYVHIMLGELDKAQGLLAKITFPEGSWEFYRLVEPRGMLLEEGGNLREALAVFLGADAAGDHPVSMWCLAGAIRVATKLGELETAEAALQRLESRADRWHASLWLLQASRAYVEEARGNKNEASKLFSEAASACPEAFYRIGLSFRAAFADGDRAAIMDSIYEFDEIGALRASDRARSEARSLGVRPGRRRSQPGILSAREREIAGLVALGKTNAEVAEDLFLSPRTVERHVSSLLDKLGCRSRVELAAEVAAGRLPNG